ncbi:hypothetical protein [Burkholderia phage BCSR129]|nr:hypothetical protein [Burkholderia phage BCSR129]
MVKVFRPESTLSDPACIDSFRNVPIINDHEFLGSQADGLTPAEKKGVEGIVCEDVHYQGGYLRATLKVFSENMKRLIDSGKDDLSCGYLCEYVHQPGTWQGQPYEYIQVDMRGNHLALVDQARCSGSRVLDSAEKPAGKGVFTMDSMEINMSRNARAAQARQAQSRRAKGKGMDSAVDQIKELIPELSEALEQFFSEEATEPAHAGGEGAEGAEGAEGGEFDETEGAEAGTEGAEAGVTTEGDEGAEGGEAAAGGDKKTRLIQLLKTALQALEGESADPAAAAAVGDDGEEGRDPMAATGDEGEEGAEGREAEDCEDEHASGHSGPRGKGGMGADSAARRPATRKPQVMDAAEIRRSVLADIEQRDELYSKLSKVVGAFKYKGMDSAQVAEYGVKALKLKCAKGSEVQALDSYLAGRAAGMKTNLSATAAGGARQAGDSFESHDAVDAYLKGSK